MSDAVIAARGLTKWYGPVIGLNDVTVEIGPGVTGLLGPNGAGKSTFLKLITGQLRPSQGELFVLGEPPWNNPRVLGRLGYCPDSDGFWDQLSGLQFVSALGRVSGLAPRAARARAEEVLARVGMQDAMHRPLRGYSRGMRQRTKLAQALVHRPALLVLDEPLTGADPVGRRELRRLIAGLAAEGTHVVLSSHVLHEVEELTRRVVLIHRGRVVAAGEVEEIRALMDEHPHRVLVRCARPRAAARALVGRDDLGVAGLELQGDDALVIETRAAAACFAALPALLLEEAGEVQEVRPLDEDLEAIFRYLVRA